MSRRPHADDMLTTSLQTVSSLQRPEQTPSNEQLGDPRPPAGGPKVLNSASCVPLATTPAPRWASPAVGPGPHAPLLDRQLDDSDAERPPGRPYGAKAAVQAPHQTLRHTHFAYVRYALNGLPLREAWLLSKNE